jgi:LacI family transcriptional regulator
VQQPNHDTRTKAADAPRRVGLLIEPTAEVFRQVLMGVAEYAQQRPGWRCEGQPAMVSQDLGPLARWDGDGLIVQGRTPGQVRQLLRLSIPIVEVYDKHEWTDRLACVDSDAVGRLGAEHLLELGHEHLAFVELPKLALSRRRRASFERTARRAGRRSLSCRHTTLTQLAAWLQTLPRPIGIMAATDGLAHRLIKACHAAGLRVPQDVAVVGAGNDPIVCAYCDPPLTSIELGASRAGWAAAELLDRLMTGQDPGPLPATVPPVRLVARDSTAKAASSDPVVAATLDRLHAPLRRTPHDPRRRPPTPDLNQLAHAAGVSRRTLERRFAAALGHSPFEATRRARVDHAAGLLLDTDLPVKTVAHQAGFVDARQMARAFRDRYDLNPSDYRRLHRRTAP